MRAALTAFGFAGCVAAVLGGANQTQIKEAVAFANEYWNCADVDCSQRVQQGAWQPNYGCAPFVSHCLSAGQFIDLNPDNPNDDVWNSFKYKGVTYNLECCYSQDSNPACHGSPGLADYLLATGWTKTDAVVAGTVAVVVGSEGPYSHVVFGVGDNLVDAHNSAAHQVSFSANYQANLLLNPSGSTPTPTGPSCATQPDGWFCGNDGIDGTANTLYYCSSGKITETKPCGGATPVCMTVPGINDECVAGKCGSLPDGWFCGNDGLSGDAHALYHCGSGAVTKCDYCKNGCKVEPHGQNDVCA